MDDHEEHSDSDSSDEDYVPGGAEHAPVSEDESDLECQDDAGSGDDDDERCNTKRKKEGQAKAKRARKKLKSGEHDNNVEEAQCDGNKTLSEEEKKKRDESLWADFMKDCGPPMRKNMSSVSPNASNGTKTDEKENNSEPAKKTTKKITQIFEFAGEKVEVEKEVNEGSVEAKKSNSAGRVNRGVVRGAGPRGGGLTAVLGMIGKKGKLTTLEKSKLDWEKFKEQEGIREDLHTHNKGKNGYLERQDFLERSDLRQFELEKEMRSSRRSNH